MAVGLIDEMLESCFVPLENALQRLKNNSPTPNDLDELIAAGGVVIEVLERIQNNIKESMAAGMEGRKLSASLKDQVHHIECSLQMLARIQEIITHGTIPAPVKEKGEASLGELVRQTEKMRDNITGLQRWVDSPRPTLDPSKLGGKENTPSAKGYERLEDLIARLDGDKP